MRPFYEDRAEKLFTARLPQLHFPAHLHSELEVVLVGSGELEVEVNGEVKRLGTGELAVIFPGDVHRYRTLRQGEGDGVAMVIASPELLGEYRELVRSARPVTPFPSGELPADVGLAMDRLCALGNDRAQEAVCRGYLQVLMAAIRARLEMVRSAAVPFDDAVYKALRFIQENSNRPLRLEEAAKQAGVSRYTLSRLFSSRLHTSFTDYLNSLRVFRAQELLRASDQSVTSIAFECGFDSQRTFNRAFQRVNGISPREFRRG